MVDRPADEQLRPTEAVVVRSTDAPVTVETIQLRAPGAGEVRVRIEAASLCHSDLSLATGVLAQPLPAVLGHEAAGTVVEVGPQVTTLAEGDRVLLLWNPPCRACWFCEHDQPHLCVHASDRARQPYAYDEAGTPLYPGLSTAAFAQQTVLAASACYLLPADVPLDLVALLGCAVTTGVGAVRHTAQVRPGESVAVVGLGGVGLAAVQGARIAGAERIIAVDPAQAKLDLARKLGATDTLAAGPNLPAEVRGLTDGRGADHVFDCVGLASTIRQSWKATRRGGAVTLVGIGGRTEVVEFSSIELFSFARRILPCVNGSLDADRDLPEYFEQVRSGELDLASLVSREIDLTGVAAGFEDLAGGRVARVLVRPNN
ncbi:MAG TPA: zinc-binding dehydrogenase [Pseudonocardiaceae bacterium]|nr:zinc-binding dehydrogenase [Pseudonocardiaceae bacterium]